MTAVTLAVVFWFVSYGLASCQEAKLFSGQPATPSLEDIRVRLLNGTEAERSTLATTLRLVIPKWTRWKVDREIPCKTFDSVRISYVTLRPPNSQAVLQIYSSACVYTYLAVFEQRPAGQWDYVDTVPLWSKNGEPRITFESLIDIGAKELIASGCTADYGTGISQTNLIILKLFQTGLQVIFDEPEHVHYSIPASSGTFRGIDQSQDSAFEFTIADVKEPSASVIQILERQLVRNHNVTITRSWLYVWLPELRIFQSVPASEKNHE